MSRRRRTSPLEDMIELAGMLPWWAGIVLAVLSYLVLSAAADRPLPVALAPADAGQVMQAGVWRAFAMVGQYLLPFVFVAGALASVFRQRKRAALVKSTTQSGSADALDGMSWQEFEQLVGEGFRRQGYRVLETGGGGADGGVDLVLAKDGEKFLVQCKQWKAFKVGVQVVRELYGVMAARGAAGGFVVTSGRFTEEAKTFAKGRNLVLVDAPALLKLIQQARTVPTATPGHRPNRASPAPQPNGQVPACPTCTQPMVRRIAKRGPSPGAAFWGCSDFPRCRGTRPMGDSDAT